MNETMIKRWVVIAIAGVAYSIGAWAVDGDNTTCNYTAYLSPAGPYLKSKCDDASSPFTRSGNATCCDWLPKEHGLIGADNAAVKTLLPGDKGSKWTSQYKQCPDVVLDLEGAVWYLESYCGSSTCASPGQAPAGAVNPIVGCIDLRFSLGGGIVPTYGPRIAGVAPNLSKEISPVKDPFVRMLAYKPSEDIYSPKALILPESWISYCDLDCITQNGVIRQVKSAKCLMDVQSNSNQSYTIRFYRPQDVYKSGSNAPSSMTYLYCDGKVVGQRIFKSNQEAINANYLVKEGCVPFSVYTISNPDVGGAINRVHITGVNHEQPVDVMFEYTDVGGGREEWVKADGVGSERVYTSIFTISNSVEEVEISTTKDASLNEVAHSETTYTVFPFGKVRTRQVQIISAGLAVTNFTTYCTNSADTGSYGRELMTQNADGSWRKYEYDTQGRKSREWSGFMDAISTAPTSQVNMTEYGYEAVDPNEQAQTYNLEPNKPRTVTVWMNGQIVSRTWHAYYESASNGRIELEKRAGSPSALYGDSGNLSTIREFNPFAENAPNSKCLRVEQHSDGRRETYDYAYGYLSTNGVAPYTFTADGTSDCTRIVVTFGTYDHPNGIINETKQTAKILDVNNRTVQEETYVCTGYGTNINTYTLLNWVAYTHDEDGRVIAERRSDGSLVETEWGCCGKTREVAADGSVTGYMYDSLKRLVEIYQYGTNGQPEVTTSYVLDAAGRRVSETLTASGVASLVTSNRYDMAGRLVWSQDASGLITSNRYSATGLITTNYLPGGAIRIASQFKDGHAKGTTGTVAVAETYMYGVDAGQQWTKVWQGSKGTNSVTWSKSTVDSLGRTVKQEKPAFGGGTLVTSSGYDLLGRLVSSSQPNGLTNLFEYNELGEQIVSAVDINRNGVIDYNSGDRVTTTDSAYQLIDGNWWAARRSSVYAGESGTAVETSVQRTQVTGLSAENMSRSVSVDVNGNVTESWTSLERDAAKLTRTTRYSDSTNDEVSVTINGRLMFSRNKAGVERAYAYDSLGRQTAVTDPRTGTSTTSFDDKGRVVANMDATGNGNGFAYDVATGRRIAETNALGSVTRQSYDIRGNLVRTWGATYPVEYGYDEFGRMTNMSTFRGGTNWYSATWPTVPGTKDTTVWRYDLASGLLTNKVYADGKGVRYTYTPDGKLATRTWARLVNSNAVVTTYTYTNGGELAAISYSDGTPGVICTYDRLGRRTSITDGTGMRAFAYDPVSLLLTNETFTGTDGISRSLARLYDESGRPMGVQLGADYRVTYGYDEAGRFSTVAAEVDGESLTFNYAYVTNSALMAQVALEGTPWRMTRSYEDQRDLITQIRTVYGTNTVAQYDYTNDELGRRTAVGNSGSAFNVVGPQHERYGYNTRSELTAADRYFGSSLASTNDPMGTRSFAYNYDNIGNRLTASRNGIANAYTANALNQYTQRGQTGLVWLAGTAATNAVVTVNEQAVTRQGEYFHKALVVSNRTVALFEPVEIVGVYNPPGTNAPDVVTIASGKVFAAKTPELFTYDADGNLLSDGRFTYSWDGENRMISAQTLTNLPATVPRVKLEFAYDYMGRRIKKTVSVSTNSSASYFITQTSTFVYDGWNMISEDLTSNASHLTNSYVWGLDLSGSLQGAGGIGGLLCASSGTGSAKRLYSCDANGNVGALLEADGAMVAHYEYDPYGKALVADGPAAKANPYRFSTKYSDDETSLYYYGYRYYQPEVGRWCSRDPMEEKGGISLYVFVQNSAPNSIDGFGLACVDVSNNSLGFSGSRNLGPVKYSYGFNVTGKLKTCDKCCPNGNMVNDETYSISGAGNLSLQGGPWQWSASAPLGANWQMSASAWIGFQLFATGSGNITGEWKTDKCNGVNSLQGQPVCLSATANGGINIGANVNGSIQRMILGQWTTIYTVSLGVYGTGQATIKLKRCYSPTTGWGPLEICSGYKTSLTVNAVIGTFSFEGPQYEQCASF